MKNLIVLISLTLSVYSIASAQQEKEKQKENEALDFNPSEMFNTMAPSFKMMYSAIMEGQLDFFEKEGMIEKIALLNKRYYDALVKAGFSKEEAMRIITSSPLIPVAAAGK